VWHDLGYQYQRDGQYAGGGMSEPQKMRDITEKEWREYQWVEVTTFGDAERVFLRGVKYTQPPKDGFHYEEDTRVGDKEQRWTRAVTPEA
jgi:hypothetical protein